MGKLLLFAAIAISIVTAGLGFYNGSQKKALSEQVNSAAAERDAAKQKLTQVETELEQAQKSLADASTTGQANTAELTKARTELQNIQNQLSQTATQISERDQKIAQLEQDSNAKQARITELENATQVTADTSELDGLKAQVEEQKTLLAKYESDNTTQKAQLEELHKQNTDRAAMKMRAGLEGRILAVNPAWNFVVLNLGDRNGVINNAEMLVKRGTQLVGKVRITSVEPSTSIADIVANSTAGGVAIQPGDSVIYQSLDE